jgi:hypothetical protein
MEAPTLWTERRAFQAIVLIASVVPISAGVAGVLDGPRMLHGVAATSPDLESHYRYLSGLLLGIGLAFVACVADLDRRDQLYRALSLIVIVGGLARLLGFLVHGIPGRAHQYAIVMELVIVPALLLWHTRIQRAAKTQA